LPGASKDFSVATVEGLRRRLALPGNHLAACNFWIAGAGHIAQAVAPLAAQLDFKVTVFE